MTETTIGKNICAAEKCSCQAKNTLQLKLQFALKNLFDGRKPGLHENLLDLLPYAQGAEDLLAAIELDFGRWLSLDELTEAPTIESLSKVLKDVPVECIRIERDQMGVSNPPIIILGGSFDHLGFANKNTYSFGRDVFLLPPVRYEAIPEPTTIEGIAAMHFETIKALAPGDSFILVGLCFHGLVAYEISRLWMARGGKPPHLILIDSTPTTYDFRKAVRMFFDVAGKFRGWKWSEKSTRVLPWFKRAMNAQGQIVSRLERLQRWSRRDSKARRSQVHDFLKRMQRKLLKPFLKLAGARKSSNAAAIAHAGSPVMNAVSPKPAPEQCNHGSTRWQQYYYWAIASHKMKPLRVPLTLFLTNDWAAQPLFWEDRGWSKWTSFRVNLERIHGTHWQCMTDQIDEVAEKLDMHSRVPITYTAQQPISARQPSTEGHLAEGFLQKTPL